MDSPSASTGHSRRRITRTGNPLGDDSTATTASSLQAGPSRLPELTQLVDVEFSDFDRSSDDLEGDDHATPRLHVTSKLPSAEGDLQTPAARLRALLNRVPNGSSPNSTPVASQPPHSIANYNSDSDAGNTTRATAIPSGAQTSLRSVFSHALRPPGDTPQKRRARRNSIDISEVDASPRTEKAKHRSKRKSLSDEEVENSYRTSSKTPSSQKSRGQAVTLDVLRHRFMNSKPDTSQDSSRLNPGDLSDDTADLLRELNSSRTSPPVATSTPQHSLEMSANSRFQMQSNLLDHDSEMHRAIEGADLYDETGFADQADTSDSRQEIDFPSASEANEAPLASAPSPNASSSTTEASTTRAPRPPPPTSNRDLHETHRSHIDKSTTSPKTPAQQRSTSSLSQQGSLSSLSPRPLSSRTRVTSSPRPSHTSSRGSSIGSQADYKERLHELDQDRALQRERDWNKNNRTLSRASSSLSLNSPEPAERQRTQSLTPSTSSSSRSHQLSPSALRSLRRHSSLTERLDSPTSSAHGSQEDLPFPVIIEVVQERERNWNSPRPAWPARTRADSISSLSSVSDDEDHDNPPSTASRLTSPRSLAEIRARVARNRLLSTPERSSSPRHSHHTHGRLADRAIASISSPSRKRHSLSTASPSASPQAAGRDTKVSTSVSRTSRTSRTSLPSPSKSESTSTTSTIRGSRKSQIPTASPRKGKAPQQSVSRLGEITPSPSEDEQPSRYAGGLRPPGQQEVSSPQELTPKQTTILPPPMDSPPPRQPSPLSESAPGVEHEELPPEFSESEMNAPFNSTPLDPSNHEMPSFTATPPRATPSVSYSKIDITSPNQSMDAPELPGPPSADESDSEPTWKTPPQTRLFPAAGNTTAFKTPKPPGGWSDTPAPRRRNRSYSDSSTSTHGNPLESPPASSNAPIWTAIQTPKPPGGWLATPAPARKVKYADRSVETDTEPEVDIGDHDMSAPDADIVRDLPEGLTTPMSSISKGKYHHVQTPAAPGAWVQTPAPRRSVMKVRFDPKADDTREYSVATTDESAVSDSANQSAQTNPLQTPPASPQLAPTSPSRRKTPSIRVLDAYGNETREEDKLNFSSVKTPRRQPIRHLDAYGNAIDDDGDVNGLGEKSDEAEPITERKDEVLSRMRRGLDELVQEIHDFDQRSSLSRSDLARIKELDSASLKSREKRLQLAKEIRSVDDDVKGQLKSLKANGIRPEPLETAPGTSKLRLGPVGLLCLLAFQIGVAIFIYRIYSSFTRDAFLTTYYDPYNPLLHLDTFKSSALLARLSEITPWATLFDLLRRGDFNLFGKKAMDNLSIHLARVQTEIWGNWGEKMAAHFDIWPPT